MSPTASTIGKTVGALRGVRGALVRVPAAVDHLGVVPCLNFGRKMMNRALIAGARGTARFCFQSVCHDAQFGVIRRERGCGVGIVGLAVKRIQRCCI